MASSLLILAGAIFLTGQQLRRDLRAQIVGRDAAILNAVAQSQLEENADNLQEEAVGDSADLGGQFTLILKVSRLAGVIGARLFDTEGKFATAFPAHVIEDDLSPQALTSIQQLRPVSEFLPSVDLAEFFLPLSLEDLEMDSVPLLIVNIPIYSESERRLSGIGQFIIEGQSIAQEFAALDRSLAFQGAIAFLVAGATLLVVIGWSFRRLRNTQRILAERTNHLLRANQELALAAKTSALGTLTAHLIHGLSNPLSGLQNFVASRSHEPEAGADWQEALRTTHRMKNLVGDLVRLLATQDDGDTYELSLAELCEVVKTKANVAAAEKGLTFQSNLDAEGVLSQRHAHLVMLILENLIENAIQASPAGGTVRLCVTGRGEAIEWQVVDQGTGVPEHLLASLFTPCRTTKPGGNGIGLAISKQLANHLGADLSLQTSDLHGSTFLLRLPGALAMGRSAEAANLVSM